MKLYHVLKTFKQLFLCCYFKNLEPIHFLARLQIRSFKECLWPSEAWSIESLVPKSSNGHGGPILSLYQEETSCFHIFSTVALQPDASPVTLNNETLPWLLRLESSQHVLPANLATTDTKTMKGNSTMPTKLCFYNPPIHAHLHHTTFPHIKMYLIVLSRDYLKSLFKKTSTRKSLQ